MKAAVLLGNSTSGDIKREELIAQWEMLREIPGLELNILGYGARPTGEEISELVPADTDALFGIWISPQYINETFFDSHPKLKYIADLAHGYGEVDFPMTRRYGVTITNTAYGDTTIAEYAFALLGALCHRVEKHSEYVKTTDWTQPDHPAYMFALTPQIELCGKTFGIVGFGKIGYCAAKIAKGYGMTVLANARHRRVGSEYDGIEQVSLDELYKRSDIISVHAPLTSETRGMLNSEAFEKMKDGVIIINTSRGGLIDENALSHALDSGKVSAAGLDVLCEEPPKGDTLKLLAHENVLATGHIAWLPKSSRMRQVTLAISNFKAYLDGKPVSVINAER